MDATLGHHTKGKGGKNCRNKTRGESIKVVYISTPMKVKTSASRFRSLVQELTGRDSDIFRYTDNDFSDFNQNTTYTEVVPRMVSRDPIEYVQRDSPTSSDSLIDDVFNSDMVERLEGMFPSSMFFTSDQLIDVPAIY